MTELPEEVCRRPLSDAPVEPLPSGLIPARVRLDGSSACVEPIDPERHAAELFAASHGVPGGEALWRYLAYGPWPTVEAFRGWLRECAAAQDPIFYAIRARGAGAACGMASYLNIVPRNGSIEIGHIWLAPALQRTRAATEALFLLMRHAMDDLRYRRLEWKCNALNEASRRAARRLGFRFEGIFHRHMIVRGRNRDTAWYSIVAEEWPAVRADIAAWLADDNFDAAGRQKRALSAIGKPR
ncbi:MAG: GNAT family N-acetyltransferase [Dongiaceae bacterium]